MNRPLSLSLHKHPLVEQLEYLNHNERLNSSVTTNARNFFINRKLTSQ